MRRKSMRLAQKKLASSKFPWAAVYARHFSHSADQGRPLNVNDEAACLVEKIGGGGVENSPAWMKQEGKRNFKGTIIITLQQSNIYNVSLYVFWSNSCGPVYKNCACGAIFFLTYPATQIQFLQIVATFSANRRGNMPHVHGGGLTLPGAD